MVAAINYYIKKPLFKDNDALYEANKLLLLEKKKGTLLNVMLENEFLNKVSLNDWQKHTIIVNI